MGFFVSKEKVTDRFGESRIRTTIHKGRIIACAVLLSGAQKIELWNLVFI